MCANDACGGSLSSCFQSSQSLSSPSLLLASRASFEEEESLLRVVISCWLIKISLTPRRSPGESRVAQQIREKEFLGKRRKNFPVNTWHGTGAELDFSNFSSDADGRHSRRTAQLARLAICSRSRRSVAACTHATPSHRPHHSLRSHCSSVCMRLGLALFHLPPPSPPSSETLLCGRHRSHCLDSTPAPPDSHSLALTAHASCCRC